MGSVRPGIFNVKQEVGLTVGVCWCEHGFCRGCFEWGGFADWNRTGVNGSFGCWVSGLIDWAGAIRSEINGRSRSIARDGDIDGLVVVATIRTKLSIKHFGDSGSVVGKAWAGG